MAQLLLGVQPFNQLRHAPRGIERRRRLKENRDLLPVVIEGCDIIGELFVFAAVAVVLLAKLEQVAVKLLDVVFGDGNLLPCMESCLHDGGLAGDFLLVTGGKRPNF